VLVREKFIVCRDPATSEIISSGDDEVFVADAGVGWLAGAKAGASCR
jgi:hypothetical protein